jgi:hypothetical protein
VNAAYGCSNYLTGQAQMNTEHIQVNINDLTYAINGEHIQVNINDLTYAINGFQSARRACSFLAEQVARLKGLRMSAAN